MNQQRSLVFSSLLRFVSSLDNGKKKGYKGRELSVETLQVSVFRNLMNKDLIYVIQLSIMF